MNIWEKLAENPRDYEVVSGDVLSWRMSQTQWKWGREAAEGLVRFGTTGDGKYLKRLLNIYRQIAAENEDGISRRQPLNTYVLAKLSPPMDSETYLWLGQEYLREGGPFKRKEKLDKARACFRKVLEVGNAELIADLALTYLKEEQEYEALVLMEDILRFAKPAVEPGLGKKLCRI